jgi:hypothetical protein
VVHAVPESQVLPTLTGGVELPGVRAVLGGILAGRRAGDEDRVALPDRHLGQLDVLHREPQRHVRDRAVQPQRLLDHVRPGRPARPQRVEPLGTGEQFDDRAAQQVRGGLVSHPDHQHQGVDEFLLAEPFAVVVPYGDH